MIDDKSTDYMIKDLLDRLANDTEWEPDDAIRKKAVALMRRYSTSV